MNATDSIWELIDFIGGSTNNNEDDDRYSAPRRAEDAEEGRAE